MKKTDWVRKLTSRKFWAAVAAFVTMAMTAAGAASGSAEKVAALIMAGASVVAYIIGEGLTDAAGAGAGKEDGGGQPGETVIYDDDDDDEGVTWP